MVGAVGGRVADGVVMGSRPWLNTGGNQPCGRGLNKPCHCRISVDWMPVIPWHPFEYAGMGIVDFG